MISKLDYAKTLTEFQNLRRDAMLFFVNKNISGSALVTQVNKLTLEFMDGPQLDYDYRYHLLSNFEAAGMDLATALDRITLRAHVYRDSERKRDELIDQIRGKQREEQSVPAKTSLWQRFTGKRS